MGRRSAGSNPHSRTSSSPEGLTLPAPSPVTCNRLLTRRACAEAMTLEQHNDDGTPDSSHDPDLLLEVRGAVKKFPGVLALSQMDLELRAGEVLALVGENGAGKSTLMKLLAGVHPPDAGSFRFLGRPLQVRGPRDAAEQGLAIIHQELNLMSTLTVAENIFLGREPVLGNFFTRPAQLRVQTQELLD